MQEFKERLKELREERGISMKELGLTIGVSDAAVCKWENGISEPKITYVLRLAQFFECSTDFLLGVTDDYVSSRYFADSVNGKGVVEKGTTSEFKFTDDNFEFLPWSGDKRKRHK